MKFRVLTTCALALVFGAVCVSVYYYLLRHTKPVSDEQRMEVVSHQTIDDGTSAGAYVYILRDKKDGKEYIVVTRLNSTNVVPR